MAAALAATAQSHHLSTQHDKPGFVRGGRHRLSIPTGSARAHPELEGEDLSTADRRGDATSRIIGSVVVGGVGGFALVFLATYARVPVEVALGLPGLGLTLGMGLFSFRRSVPWGIAAGVLGFLWTVAVVWLQAPTENNYFDLVLRLPFTVWGAPHAVLVLTVGWLAGSGWKKAALASSRDDQG